MDVGDGMTKCADENLKAYGEEEKPSMIGRCDEEERELKERD